MDGLLMEGPQAGLIFEGVTTDEFLQLPGLPVQPGADPSARGAYWPTDERRAGFVVYRWAAGHGATPAWLEGRADSWPTLGPDEGEPVD